MALYRETATGFLGEFATNPGAGWTAVSAMPTTDIASRVTWWRAVDIGSLTSAWHPSAQQNGEDPIPWENNIAASLDNSTFVFTASTSGTVSSYSGSGTAIRVVQGQTTLNYDGVGTSNGTWKVVAAGTGITPGSITDSGSFATVGDHSGMADATNTATITYTITGISTTGKPFTIYAAQTFSKSKTGDAGTNTATLVAYKRAATQPADNPGALMYTFATAGWTPGNSWSKTIPAGVDPLWSTQAVASANTATDSILAIDWTTPAKVVENTVLIDLNNEAHTVPTDGAGGNGDFTGCATTATVYVGLTDDSANWTFAAPTVTGGVTGTVSNLNRTYTVTGMTGDVGTVTFSASKTGYTTVTTVFTVTKAKSGVAYSIVPSVGAVGKTAAGSYNPATVVFSAYKLVSGSGSAAYAGRIKVETQATIGGAWTAQYTSVADESSYTYTVPANIVSIRASLYLAGGTVTLLDQETLPVVVDGTPGSNATRTAELVMYQWAATAPTTFPSGTSMYTWATGVFTAPATVNGWSLTPPAAVAGQTLWACKTIYTDTLTATTSSVTWAASSAYAVGGAGSNGGTGANGYRTCTLEVFQWASSTPTVFPSGTSNYTWATGAFTAPTTPNSWTLSPGTPTAGQTLYACKVTYADQNTTTTSPITWNTSSAYVVGKAGTDGATGVRGSKQASASTTELSWTANAALLAYNTINTAYGTPVVGDLVTLYNSGAGWVETRWYVSGAGTASVWNTYTYLINGNVLINGTVGASALAASQIWSKQITLGSSGTDTGAFFKSADYNGSTSNPLGTPGTAGFCFNGAGDLALNGVFVRNPGNLVAGATTRAGGYGSPNSGTNVTISTTEVEFWYPNQVAASYRGILCFNATLNFESNVGSAISGYIILYRNGNQVRMNLFYFPPIPGSTFNCNVPFTYVDTAQDTAATTYSFRVASVGGSFTLRFIDEWWVELIR